MSSKTLPSDVELHEQTGVDYWRLFRDLPEPYVLFEASDPDYVIIETNKARDKMTGMSRAECVGRSLLDTYPYTDELFQATAGKHVRARLKEIIRTGRSQQLEPFRQMVTDTSGAKQSIYMQATYFPLRNSSGQVRYILLHAREVTDELQARERVATAESRLVAALTIGKVGSWVFDAATGHINGDENFRKLFNMTRQGIKELDLNEFFQAVHEEDRRRVRAAVERSVTRRVPFEEECRIVLNDGTQRWILARGGVEDHDGQLLFPGVVMDITEQRDLQAQIELARRQERLNRQAARTLQQRNEELEAISRSKDEFVALASHQLRTPVTAVKQYIGMVLQGYVGEINEEQVDVLTKAFEGNERQIQIINQILSAARADTGRLVMMPMPVNLCSLVRSIAAEMEAVFEQRQQTLTLSLPRTAVQVSADMGYLRMAIENVLHNANVYTPAGGTVAINITRTAKHCNLRITDTGVGIKKADLGKLFVKFSRIHNPLSVEAGGSGIGLYLTAEIARLHGGEVSVESRIGKGSSFAISLPLMQNETKPKQSR